VAKALRSHPSVSRFLDLTEDLDIDYEFVFERQLVHVDLKEKHSPLSVDYREAWPEVPPADLFLVDELSWRKLLWREGMGYLLIHDRPEGRWCVFGPWELALGPRRRLERVGDKGNGPFRKGKLLIDLRSAATASPVLDVDAFLNVVRQSRVSLHKVESIPLPNDGPLPTVPRRTVEVAPTPGRVDDPAQSDGEAEDTRDPVWAGLSPRLVRAITSNWGWTEPTVVQRTAFPVILAAQNALVLAPTAGGKTEAALLPLLDMWQEDGWGRSNDGLSILAISPLKALLDDQLERWRKATALVRATTFAWHGDVSLEARRSFKDDPSDALLTTPESLENLLTSPAHDASKLFANVRAVVVDEVHAFVGTPRGAQLASLLERLQQVSEAAGGSGDFQRIGLSATVADPEQVLDWLRGGSLREHRVVTGGSPVHGEDLSIRSYEDLDEAAGVIAGLINEQRSIIFARSRRRSEELANHLGLPVHHSSVAAASRVNALDDLAAGRVHSIVATAGLEMGIDIADLDLVVQDGAPTGPGSYLQRLGRAGRRTGRRRMAFTLGTPEELLLTLGVLNRVRRGDLDPLPPRQGARLVLGQQVLAQVLQSTVVRRELVREMLRWSTVFSGLEEDIHLTIDHLLDGGWLVDVDGRLVAGATTNARFGGPTGIARLLATFTTADAHRVESEEGQLIGFLDPGAVGDEGSGRRRAGIVLGGRAWNVVRVRPEDKVIVVQAAARGRAPSWKGPSLDVSRSTWESVREVLAGTEVPVEMDARAQAWLEEERRRWSPLLQSPLERADGATMIHSFGGLAVHRAALAGLGLEGTATGPTLTVEADAVTVAERAKAARARVDDVVLAEAARVAPSLPVRHPDLLPQAVLLAEASEFHVDRAGIVRCVDLAVGQPWPS
jgi:ATP-dependent Lhr-like helicase